MQISFEPATRATPVIRSLRELESNSLQIPKVSLRSILGFTRPPATRAVYDLPVVSDQITDP